jgi:hypothetical protein
MFASCWRFRVEVDPDLRSESLHRHHQRVQVYSNPTYTSFLSAYCRAKHRMQDVSFTCLLIEPKHASLACESNATVALAGLKS